MIVGADSKLRYTRARSIAISGTVAHIQSTRSTAVAQILQLFRTAFSGSYSDDIAFVKIWYLDDLGAGLRFIATNLPAHFIATGN